MKPVELRGSARLAGAIRNSCRGLADAWRREPAFRMEAMLLVPALPAAIWIADNIAQFALLIGSILFLLLVEIVNSAIETIIDRISEDQHELSRIAKDLGSAAVMLSTLFPFGAWGILFLNKINVISI